MGFWNEFWKDMDKPCFALNITWGEEKKPEMRFIQHDDSTETKTIEHKDYKLLK